MASFSYTGRDAGGKVVSGTLDAGNAAAVAKQLQQDGVIPTRINESSSKASNEIELNFSFGKKVSDDELIVFTRQMYSLTKAGVPINKAMRGLTFTLKNPEFVEVLGDIEKCLNSGITMSTAMHRHSDIFPNLYVSMIHVGENSGRLDDAFKQLVEHLERDQETKRQINGALRYPMFVGLALVIAVIVLNIFVIPVFADLFAEFGAELPLMTKVLLATSAFFIDYGYLLLVATVVGVFAFMRWIDTHDGRLIWDRFKLRVPFGWLDCAAGGAVAILPQLRNDDGIRRAVVAGS